MLPLCFAAFTCFGMVLILIGANQAEIAAALGLDLTRSGLLGSALALGIGTGVVAAGPCFDRWSRRPLFVGSTLLAAVALLSVDPAMDYPRLLLAVALVGLGVGAYDTFVSAVIVERFRERAVRPMTLVHAGATLGAMLGPLIVGVLAARFDWTASFRWTGAAHLAIAALAFAVDFPAPLARTVEARPSALAALRSPALVPFLVIAFAYVGVETSMTIFAVPYATGALVRDAAAGRAAITALWLGLFLGRMGTAALPSRSGAWPLLAAGTAGAAILTLGVMSGSPHVVAIFGVLGLALGCVYPIMIARAGQQFPRIPGTAAGLVAGAGAAGGFFVPWLTGVVGDGAGIATGIGCGALWCALVAAGGFAAMRLRPPEPEPLR